MKYLVSTALSLIILGFGLLIFESNDVHLISVHNLNSSSLATNINSAGRTISPNTNQGMNLNSIEMKITNASVMSPILETQVGTMSAYGPNCVGCSGHLGGGFDASDGSYIYNDPTYGNVRIVAGDPQYPYGTIIRISNTKAGDFNAIVLDRGGDIGIGRRFLFDLLFPSESEAAAFGTSYDVTVDVLRFGY